MLEKSNPTTDKAQRIAPSGRQPAYVRGVFGEKSKTAKVIDSIVSPAEQIKAKKDKAATNKAKAESEAAARRAQYRKEGVLKTELIKYEKNGQWSLDKGDVMAPRPKSKLDVPVKDVYNGDDHTKEVGGKGVDGDKGKTVKAGKNP